MAISPGKMTTPEAKAPPQASNLQSLMGIFMVLMLISIYSRHVILISVT